jgi:hypothetical protein
VRFPHATRHKARGGQWQWPTKKAGPLLTLPLKYLDGKELTLKLPPQAYQTNQSRGQEPEGTGDGYCGVGQVIHEPIVECHPFVSGECHRIDIGKSQGLIYELIGK